MNKFISVVTPTFNEIGNIELLYKEIKKIFQDIDIKYEHIVIDNNSDDGTQELLKKIAKDDKNFKVIINSQNFGQVKSPFHGLIQGKGDATILICADFQTPLSVIPKLIEKWNIGEEKIILTQKITSEENIFLKGIRNFYYLLLKKFSEKEIVKHTTGDGIYDKEIIKIFRRIEDPSPFLRGLVSEIGYKVGTVEYDQQNRKFGKTKNNFFSLFDVALLGLIKHSNFFLRMMTIFGLIMGVMSFLSSVTFLLYKLFFWNSFQLGIAPLVIGMFFLASIQIFFLGLIGEYVSLILSYKKKYPLVIEKERINF
ncbi:glycosyltransferase family 2 protein [Candidatus Pelagibacter ubique]|nr:glycosyltransferase family 2 protein [Candidatus Pelagibacter ubique]